MPLCCQIYYVKMRHKDKIKVGKYILQVFLSIFSFFSIHLSQYIHLEFLSKECSALAMESPDFSLNSRELRGFLAWKKQLPVGSGPLVSM